MALPLDGLEFTSFRPPRQAGAVVAGRRDRCMVPLRRCGAQPERGMDEHATGDGDVELRRRSPAESLFPERRGSTAASQQ
jgi:hypothetical protein